MAKTIEVNGHVYVHDWDVGERAKRDYGEECSKCGAPRYAHQINVIEFPAPCRLFRPG